MSDGGMAWNVSIGGKRRGSNAGKGRVQQPFVAEGFSGACLQGALEGAGGLFVRAGATRDKLPRTEFRRAGRCAAIVVGEW